AHPSSGPASCSRQGSREGVEPWRYMGLTPLAAWGTRVGRGHDDRILRVETCVMQPSGAPGQGRRAPETEGGTDVPGVPPRTGRGPEAVSPVQLLTPPALLFVSSP